MDPARSWARGGAQGQIVPADQGPEGAHGRPRGGAQGWVRCGERRSVCKTGSVFTSSLGETLLDSWLQLLHLGSQTWGRGFVGVWFVREPRPEECMSCTAPVGPREPPKHTLLPDLENRGLQNQGFLPFIYQILFLVFSTATTGEGVLISPQAKFPHTLNSCTPSHRVHYPGSMGVH